MSGRDLLLFPKFLANGRRPRACGRSSIAGTKKRSMARARRTRTKNSSSTKRSLARGRLRRWTILPGRLMSTRIQEYMLKALREAKVNSSWIEPNEEWEKALHEFIGKILDPANIRFLNSFEPFAAKIAQWGAINSLSQTTLKLTLPGVPDFYQGSELWDFSLVDPDNRRPVDYQRATSRPRGSWPNEHRGLAAWRVAEWAHQTVPDSQTPRPAPGEHRLV